MDKKSTVHQMRWYHLDSHIATKDKPGTHKLQHYNENFGAVMRKLTTRQHDE
jgi:hypothetical protein